MQAFVSWYREYVADNRQPPPPSNRAWWTELDSTCYFHGVVPSPKKGWWDVIVHLPNDVSPASEKQYCFFRSGCQVL